MRRAIDEHARSTGHCAHDGTQVAVAWKRLRRLVPYVALIYNCKLAWAHARLNPDGGSGFADLREDFVAHGGSA